MKNDFDGWLVQAKEHIDLAHTAFHDGKKTQARQCLRLAIDSLREANYSADLHNLLAEQPIPVEPPAVPEPMPGRESRRRRPGPEETKHD